MSKAFDVRDLLRVAIIDERSGAGMYRVLAERAADARLKQRFADLEAQEHEHERRFEKMLEEMPESVATETHPDPYVQYLETLVAEGAGREGQAGQIQAQQVTEDRDAIELAMRFEREQLQLLADAGNALGDSHREAVDAVIAEERAHLVDLAAAKRELRGG